MVGRKKKKRPVSSIMKVSTAVAITVILPEHISAVHSGSLQKKKKKDLKMCKWSERQNTPTGWI